MYLEEEKKFLVLSDFKEIKADVSVETGKVSFIKYCVPKDKDYAIYEMKEYVSEYMDELSKNIIILKNNL